MGITKVAVIILIGIVLSYSVSAACSAKSRDFSGDGVINYRDFYLFIDGFGKKSADTYPDGFGNR